MLRLVAAYRWELWLLVGVPAVAQITRIILIVLASRAFGDSNTALHLPNIGVSLSVVLLLAFSYARVRALGRDFLALLWGYRIAAATLAVVIQSAVLLTTIVYPSDESPLLGLVRNFSST